MYWIMEREDFPNTSENTSSSFQIGNGEAVLGAVLLSGQHIGELHTVAHQVTELADVRRWDKAGLDHAAHIQVANPLGVLAVGFVALLRFRVFRVRQGDPTGLFKDIEYRNPVFPVDSMQTSEQEYFASQSARSLSPLENEEKRACLYSVRPLESVIPIQANIQVL